MDQYEWKSKKMYKHPRCEAYGYVVQYPLGGYGLQVGHSNYSCPQDWASKIHFEEQTGKAAYHE